MLPASQFSWVDVSWYYLQGWAPATGWDLGTWYQGSQLYEGLNDRPSATYFAIRSADRNNTYVLADNRENTQQAIFFNKAQFA